MSQDPLIIGPQGITISDVMDVARHDRKVSLSRESKEIMKGSRDLVERFLREGRTVYGITTGVGELANTIVGPEDIERLQRNLILSHCAGVDRHLDREVVRAAMVLRAVALTRGYSGVRPVVVETLLEMLNAGVTPRIPLKGSVGASGDLAQLAHMASPMIGEGKAFLGRTFRAGDELQGREAMDRAGIPVLTLQAKEGIALINGTQFMEAFGVLLVMDGFDLLKHALVAGSMSLEGLKGTERAFDPRIHALRPHPGQVRCAAAVRRLVKGSEIIASHKGCDRVQDAYTLRCIPQVYGATYDALKYLEGVVAIELNSVTDNPLVFEETEEAISGGNFHGQPLALALDLAAMALAEIADISERTLDRLVNPHLSGLPPFLLENTGLNSGYMIAQYTAASIVSENKVLAHPSSIDSIPTSAGQEDHVSMGYFGGRKALAVLRNARYVIGTELLLAAQALEFHRPLKAGGGVELAHEVIRRTIPATTEDVDLNPLMEAAFDLVRAGDVVREVEGLIGDMTLPPEDPWSTAKDDAMACHGGDGEQ